MLCACLSFGHTPSRSANRFCEVCFTQHGSTYTPFRMKMRFLRFVPKPSMKEPPQLSGCTTIRLPAAKTLHAATTSCAVCP